MSGVTSTRRPVVAVVHLGNPGSLGGRARVRSLCAIFAAGGADTVEIPLWSSHHRTLRNIGGTPVVAVARGVQMPETLAWDAVGLTAELDRLRPDLVVCVTGRAFDQRILKGPWQTVVDFVDKMSDSYRDRAALEGRSWRAPLLRALGWSAERFERSEMHHHVLRTAAGYADAGSLGAEWVPNVYEVGSPAAIERDHDLLFLGKLSFAPNFEALARLAEWWPALAARRPATRLLVAGADPPDQVRAWCAAFGWSLAADFDDLRDIVGRVRLAVVPVAHASGIQNKVLETMALGLPQVVDRCVLSGFAPGLPVDVADDDAEFVTVVASLLDNPAALDRRSVEVRDAVAARYTPGCWADWAAGVLGRRSR